jgi:hypothetical protein
MPNSVDVVVHVHVLVVVDVVVDVDGLFVEFDSDLAALSG